MHHAMKVMQGVLTLARVRRVDHERALVVTHRAQTSLYRFTKIDIFRRQDISGIVGAWLIHSAVGAERMPAEIGILNVDGSHHENAELVRAG